MDLKMMLYYERITAAKDRIDLSLLNEEIKEEIEFNMMEVKDAVILQIAIQVKLNAIMIQDILYDDAIAGLLEPPEPEDIEKEQLEDFAEEEFEDFKNNNVIPMKGFKKKD